MTDRVISGAASLMRVLFRAALRLGGRGGPSSAELWEREPWPLPQGPRGGDRRGPHSFFGGLRGPLGAPSLPAHLLGSWAAVSPPPPASNGYCRRFSPSASPNSSREQNRRPSPPSASAPALRVQSGWAGLFRAAPRGRRWQRVSGPAAQTKKEQDSWLPIARNPRPRPRPAPH